MNLAELIYDYADAVAGLDRASERGGPEDQKQADAELHRARRALNRGLEALGLEDRL